MKNLDFDYLYILGLIGDQYENFSCANGERVSDLGSPTHSKTHFIPHINELAKTENLDKTQRNLMIHDDVSPKLPLMKEYFCIGGHKNCNISYPNHVLY